MRSLEKSTFWSVSYIAAACILLLGCKDKSVGHVLTYEVNSDVVLDKSNVNIAELVTQINHRLKQDGFARVIGPERIEVDVYGELEPTELQNLKRRIGGMGQLEFRICADGKQTKDQPIIDAARSLSPDEKVVLLDGKKVAEWIPYSVAEFGAVDAVDKRLTVRTANDVPEALVLVDPWNIDGAHLISAETGLTELHDFAVNFRLSRNGGRRMSQLTSTNKPNPATGAERYLAIILDKFIFTAPAIRETISESGQISGRSMTEDDVRTIVAVLKEGALPSPIRLKSERSVDQLK